MPCKEPITQGRGKHERDGEPQIEHSQLTAKEAEEGQAV